MRIGSQVMNGKGLLLVFVLLLMAGFVQIFFKELKYYFDGFIRSDWLLSLAIPYVCVAVLAKSFFESGRDSLTFANYAGCLFSIGTLVTALMASVSLLSGLYFQSVYGELYFKNFGFFDKLSVFVVSSYLFIYAILQATGMYRDVIFLVSASSLDE